jgi:hypothetical protein
MADDDLDDADDEPTLDETLATMRMVRDRVGNDGSPAAQRLNETVEALEVMVAATHELEQTGQANDEA